MNMLPALGVFQYNRLACITARCASHSGSESLTDRVHPNLSYAVYQYQPKSNAFQMELKFELPSLRQFCEALTSRSRPSA